MRFVEAGAGIWINKDRFESLIFIESEIENEGYLLELVKDTLSNNEYEVVFWSLEKVYRDEVSEEFLKYKQKNEDLPSAISGFIEYSKNEHNLMVNGAKASKSFETPMKSINDALSEKDLEQSLPKELLNFNQTIAKLFWLESSTSESREEGLIRLEELFNVCERYKLKDVFLEIGTIMMFWFVEERIKNKDVLDSLEGLFENEQSMQKELATAFLESKDRVLH